jgi:hypothetical protein
MIAQILNAAIILLLAVLVAVPATMAIARTLREGAARRHAARAREHPTGQRAGATSFDAGEPRVRLSESARALAGRPAKRESSEVYRRLRETRQNARQTMPGDRVRSPSGRPSGG